jgi:hypothetical protein
VADERNHAADDSRDFRQPTPDSSELCYREVGWRNEGGVIPPEACPLHRLPLSDRALRAKRDSRKAGRGGGKRASGAAGRTPRPDGRRTWHGGLCSQCVDAVRLLPGPAPSRAAVPDPWGWAGGATADFVALPHRPTGWPDMQQGGWTETGKERRPAQGQPHCCVRPAPAAAARDPVRDCNLLQLPLAARPHGCRQRAARGLGGHRVSRGGRGGTPLPCGPPRPAPAGGKGGSRRCLLRRCPTAASRGPGRCRSRPLGA